MNSFFKIVLYFYFSGVIVNWLTYGTSCSRFAWIGATKRNAKLKDKLALIAEMFFRLALRGHEGLLIWLSWFGAMALMDSTVKLWVKGESALIRTKYNKDKAENVNKRRYRLNEIKMKNSRKRLKRRKNDK